MLRVVPTPIGNLGDLSARARAALENCDLLAAEDTRQTGLLLQRLGLPKKPMMSLHEHNEARRAEELAERMAAEGLQVALVCDAGTPGISDPGARLVRACRQRGIPVEVLPGPCAALTALVASGFPLPGFYFGGFLPVKAGPRRRVLAEAMARPVPSVFYESPHRLLKTLHTLADLDPQRSICVARELTKRHEEVRVGPAAEQLAHFTAAGARGEFCLVISAASRRAGGEEDLAVD